jgi:hypothetical protein
MKNLQTRMICCLALVAGGTLTTAGCNRGGTDRCAVTGAVTLKGQPVNGGNIQFAPMSVKQVSASGAVILDGRYTIPRQSGLAAGKYRVRIYWPEKAGIEQGPNVPLPKERVPAKYNADSELTAEVRERADNTFDFAL